MRPMRWAPGISWVDVKLAGRMLERAIELDPDFAQAHAWLSRYHIIEFHQHLRPESLQTAEVSAATEAMRVFQSCRSPSRSGGLAA